MSDLPKFWSLSGHSLQWKGDATNNLSTVQSLYRGSPCLFIPCISHCSRPPVVSSSPPQVCRPFSWANARQNTDPRDNKFCPQREFARGGIVEECTVGGWGRSDGHVIESYPHDRGSVYSARRRWHLCILQK
ncbi:hypothetical protein Bbelb_439780 [Branchiostoma belcheri]|nr:hypothetical protein Bbelb_439780 [Branchiostoma belcheri]